MAADPTARAAAAPVPAGPTLPRLRKALPGCRACDAAREEARAAFADDLAVVAAAMRPAP